MIMMIIIIIKFLIIQKFILEQLNINSNTITNTITNTFPTFVHKDIIGCLLPIIGPIIIILSILLFIVFKNWCLKKDNEKFIFFDEIIKAVQDDVFILSVFLCGMSFIYINKECKSSTLVTYVFVNLMFFIIYKLQKKEFNRELDDNDKKFKKFFIKNKLDKLIIIVFWVFNIPIFTSIQDFFKLLFNSFGVESIRDFKDSIILVMFFYPSLFWAYKLINHLLKIYTISNEELNNRTDELEKRVKILEENVDGLEENNNKKINF